MNGAAVATVATWAAGLVGGLLLLGVLLFIRPDADRDAAIRAYGGDDSQFLALPDGAIAHVRIDGPADGAPIVLLHGFASSAWAWDGWAADLEADHRVICVDLLGHGLTKMAPGASAWRTDQTRFLAETLDALGVHAAVIAGNSMGGGIAWAFAAQHPARVRALILVDAAGPSPDGPPLRVRAMQSRWYAPLLRFAFRWAGGTILMGQGAHSGGGDASFVTPADVKRLDVFWRLHRGELLHAMQSTHATQSPPPLSAITAPTLVMQGGKDKLVPRATAEALVAGIRNAELLVYPDLGHTPHQQDPARTVRDVRAFLEKTTGRTGG